MLMWKENRDAFSEMTICVARRLRGCTKFPRWEYAGPASICAIKLPAAKMGFDSEAWQDQSTSIGGAVQSVLERDDFFLPV